MSVLGCLLIGAFLIILGFVVVPFIFMVLWNIVAPAFNLPQLDFVQAFAIVVLLEIVGSFFRRVVTR